MQEFIKLLGEANRSTEPWWNEGFAIKGSFLYRGTGIFFFALRLVLMDGLIACALCRVASLYSPVSTLVCLNCTVSKGTFFSCGEKHVDNLTSVFIMSHRFS
jgi:hypothetical protein